MYFSVKLQHYNYVLGTPQRRPCSPHVRHLRMLEEGARNGSWTRKRLGRVHSHHQRVLPRRNRTLLHARIPGDASGESWAICSPGIPQSALSDNSVDFNLIFRVKVEQVADRYPDDQQRGADRCCRCQGQGHEPQFGLEDVHRGEVKRVFVEEQLGMGGVCYISKSINFQNQEHFKLVEYSNGTSLYWLR